MHAGKLDYKEHLIISVLENKYSTLFAKNNPSSKHSVPTMTTQSSTREISFPPVQGKKRVHAKPNLAVPVSTVTTDQVFAFQYIQLFGSVNQLPLTWLSHCTLPQAQAAQPASNFISSLVFPLLFSLVCRPALPAPWRKQTSKIISFTEPNIPGQSDIQTTNTSLPRIALN